VGRKHGCLLLKLHSLPSCFFLLIISSLPFLGYFLMLRYLSEGSQSCSVWFVFYVCLLISLLGHGVEGQRSEKGKEVLFFNKILPTAYRLSYLFC
jgi:hypothetical protein